MFDRIRHEADAGITAILGVAMAFSHAFDIAYRGLLFLGMLASITVTITRFLWDRDDRIKRDRKNAEREGASLPRRPD